MDVRLLSQGPPEPGELAERSRLLLDSCFPLLAETAEESVSGHRPELDGEGTKTNERYGEAKKNTFHQKVYRLNAQKCCEYLWGEGDGSLVNWDEILKILSDSGLAREKPPGEVFFKGRLVALLRHGAATRARKGEQGKEKTGVNEEKSPPDESGAGGGSKRKRDGGPASGGGGGGGRGGRGGNFFQQRGGTVSGGCAPFGSCGLYGITQRQRVKEEEEEEHAEHSHGWGKERIHPIVKEKREAGEEWGDSSTFEVPVKQEEGAASAYAVPVKDEEEGGGRC
uniref:Uncharacterized protein n=1 Tax=Chromera velia CCMP2878 TaxID=1169474 RepID=A0A0G4I313_9ALVE|eukprot:Cvel_10556.t1-p1 / transcript=Cvel_10556.t1 / gene=Cvel_10556 / organism=Chromera_velia_CCMP2878 / gene_product=hypothetical protein / transcript_product=hypothetical protein / location=Cvel_scaffold639:32477-33319(+) / protein_length=281 / sequence_SO=supercontig / SO=protein_coding / is_pseudo=false